MEFSSLQFELPSSKAANDLCDGDIQDTTRGRGRPLREPVDQFRTQIWFEYISAVEGLSAYKLEQKYEIGQFQYEGALNARPKKWDRYRRGDSSPNAAQIEKMGRKHPESEYIINHPLWDMLRRKPPTAKAIIDHIMPISAALGRYLSKLCFSTDKLPNTRNLQRTTDILWRAAGASELMALVGAYRIGLLKGDKVLTRIVKRPILGIALTNSAFGNQGQISKDQFYYIAALVNNSKGSESTNFPDEVAFSHVVNRMQALGKVISERYEYFFNVEDFTKSLSYWLSYCGFLDVVNCELKSLEEDENYKDMSQVRHDQILLDFTVYYYYSFTELRKKS